MALQGATIKELSLDEIVAHNLNKLIEEQRISITDLAQALGVSRGVVYDMLDKRKGHPQRPFRWSEIVSLAVALDVLVFDLVLPSDDVAVDAGMYVIGVTAAELWNRPLESVEHLHVGALFRDEVALALFGFPGGVLDEHLAGLRRGRSDGKEERQLSVEEFFSDRIERTESLMSELEKRLSEILDKFPSK